MTEHRRSTSLGRPDPPLRTIPDRDREDNIHDNVPVTLPPLEKPGKKAKGGRNVKYELSLDNYFFPFAVASLLLILMYSCRTVTITVPTEYKEKDNTDKDPHLVASAATKKKWRKNKAAKTELAKCINALEGIIVKKPDTYKDFCCKTIDDLVAKQNGAVQAPRSSAFALVRTLLYCFIFSSPL